MEINTLTIPIYNWGITIYSNVVTDNDLRVIKSQLESGGLDGSSINGLDKNLRKYNSGNHVCNPDRQLAYLIFSPIYNELGFWRVVSHEIDCLVSIISNTHNLDLESKGYISGFIYESLYQLGVLDNLRDYAERIVEVSPIPDLNKDDLLIITDDDIDENATIDTLFDNIKSTDKINLSSVHKSIVTVYTGRLGFTIIKNNYGYSDDAIKSVIG